MDMWSDPNLTPYMAVTAHWIETKIQQTAHGPQHILQLRADLVGFTRVPGHHSGEHLAQAFIHINQIKILHKVYIVFRAFHSILTIQYIDWMDHPR
jgi:hypothetical protein